jgi:hypothetical protein
MAIKESQIIFTPDNEPYLGRELLIQFDKIITACLEQNAQLAPRSHQIVLSELQEMACQVIPQAISISLSIRELIRQGYLFGAYVLLRSLVERAMILFYLQVKQSDIEKWKRGWRQAEAPGLAKMIEEIQTANGGRLNWRGHDVTAFLNSLVHGKPDSEFWNLIELKTGGMGHSTSKILNRPKLCDQLCADTIPMLAIVQSMMSAYFPN